MQVVCTLPACSVRDTALVPIAVPPARAVEGVVDVDPQLTGAPTAV